MKLGEVMSGYYMLRHGSTG